MESRCLLASVAGSVFADNNSDGNAGPGEPGIPGVVVYLDNNANGVLDQLGITFEPDAFAEGQVLNHALNHALKDALNDALNDEANSIVVSATTSDNRPAFHVTAHADPHASTGQLVFGQRGVGTWDSGRRLRFDFTTPARSVSLDVIGATVANSSVHLDAFNSAGQLLERAAVDNLRNASRDQLTIARDPQDIAFLVAYVTSDDGLVRFDNLRVDDAGSERSTLTSATGFYRFDDVPSGTSVVAQQVPAGYEQTSPFPNVGYETRVGSSVTNLNFGNHTSRLTGIAFDDRGHVGTYEPGGPDTPRAAVALFVDLNRNGLPDTRTLSVDPSKFVEDEVLDLATPGLTLSVVDAGHKVVPEDITAVADQLADPNGHVFGHDNETAWHDARRLRADFDTPASVVQLDFIAATDDARGVLQAFNVNGEPLATQTTGPLGAGKRQTITIERSGHDMGSIIAYAVGPAEAAGRLDNLAATSIGEPVVVTETDGSYELTDLAAGTYRIAALEVPGRTVSFPEAASYEQEIMFGETIQDLDFGVLNTNRAPRAADDLAETPEDTALTIAVLENDKDADGLLNTATVTIVERPRNGTADVNVDGQIEYTPESNFFGVDTLVYSVSDDLAVASNPAVVTIKVTSVNDAPLARADAATVSANSFVVIDVLGNDVDVDGELVRESLTITKPPASGVVKVDAVNGTVVYTPHVGASGIDTFRYTVADDRDLVSDAAEVQVTLRGDGRMPTANPDTTTTEEGTTVRIPVLANDTGADGVLDRRTLTVTSPPTQGTTTVDPVTGQVAYQPERGFVGEDTFQYVVRDDAGRASNVAVVNISVVERTFPYQNPDNPLDIDGDGQIVPLDALLIINELNGRHVSDAGTGKISSNPVPPNRPAGYFDVTGDGFITSGDAIRVINVLNAKGLSSAAAEGESLDPRAVAAALADGLPRETSEKRGLRRYLSDDLGTG